MTHLSWSEFQLLLAVIYHFLCVRCEHQEQYRYNREFLVLLPDSDSGTVILTVVLLIICGYFVDIKTDWRKEKGRRGWCVAEAKKTGPSSDTSTRSLRFKWIFKLQLPCSLRLRMDGFGIPF